MLNPLPRNTQPIVAYLSVSNASAAIDYYTQVFHAQEMQRIPSPDGKKIMHAELMISGCMVYLTDACNQTNVPKVSKKTPGVGLTLYCLDADKLYQRSLDHGAKPIRPVELQFWGDKMGTVCDPFGHHWTFLQRVEDLSPDQMESRASKAMAGVG